MNWAARIRLVQVARRRLGLRDEDYRAILREYGGADSAKDLDDAGFDQLMDRFRQLGFVSDKRKGAFSPHHRPGMATAAQIGLIRELWAGVSKDSSAVALDRWLSRFGPSALRFLDDKTAPRVIAALRGWRARLEAKVEDDA